MPVRGPTTIAAASGSRAVRSTPLADQDGRLLGMLSTQLPHPYHQPAAELAAMRRLGGLMGQVMSTRLPAPQALEDAWAITGPVSRRERVMDQKELARAVAERSGLSREESADLSRAVLEAIAGQLSDGEARRMAAELPGAGQQWQPRRHRPEARPVGLDEFITQVSRHTGLTEAEARSGAAAVLAALRQRLSEDRYRHLIGQLPAEYAGLTRAAG